MKTLLLTIALVLTGILSAQEMELDGQIYGSITSTMYKESKLTKAVGPRTFHELTLKYEGYRIFFATRTDFMQCMKDYGSTVSWELTPEEQRNLRNYIKRNGGSLPKFKPERVQVIPSTASIEEPEPQVEKSAPIEMVVIEQQPLPNDTVVINAVQESISTSEVTDEPRVITPTYENRPLNNRREVRVTPPMAYEGGRLTMMGQRLTARDAKYISRSNAPMAFKHFRRAANIRAWNYIWGFYSISTMATGISDGDGVLTGIGIGISGFIAVRESKRIEAIEKGVLEYNLTLPGSD